MYTDESFKIIVDDTYCAWEYEVQFPNPGEGVSIQDIIDAVCKELKGEVISRKLIKEFKP